MPSRKFQDQTVLVTGGSSGLGLAIAEAFAQAGACVCLVARNEDRLELAADELKRQGHTRITTFSADVTCNEQVDNLFHSLERQSPELNVLVNAVGVSDRAAILDVSPERFQRLWELNFLAVVRCTRAAAPMLVRSRGRIVNIGSLASKVAPPYLGAYPATKFALAAYSQQLRLELQPRGVRVLLVCPGPVERKDAGSRYDALAADLPPSARQPGGGANLKAIDASDLAQRIVSACDRGKSELVIPPKVKWLAAVAQIVPSWADRVLLKRTGSDAK